MSRFLLACVTLSLVVVPALRGQQGVTPGVPNARPIQVTDSAVARGRELFQGQGNGIACHGAAGVGTDSGPAIAQGIWMHGTDSYEGILSRVMHGIPRDVSTRATAMPMRGWNTLSDQQARDVAAYVWTISHAWASTASPH